ncbi:MULTISPECIES: TetR/AcrR family transcriptional regulator [unclassified Enterococcus]|jgi:AcrR family transcriptional regulator|uniref:TetR/AcrR family transcriptional regulator n=1 Tax=unclassified Enterococcus TaxID=2608891 RepID=UPI00035359EC|nr:transcriptional regulator, TetR family [Enterococcus faecalis 13-SD-W-01]
MRRKVYTKEQILKAAYEVVAKEGFKGFTARNIAKKMGISTQPIYLEFENMDDLKNTLLDSILENLKEEVFPVERTGDKIIDLGLNYIYFAQKHHSLYMALFIDEHGDGQKMHDFSYNYFKEIVKEDEHYSHLSEQYIDALHTGTWIVVTGLASLMSSNIMHPTEEQIINLIRQSIDMILKLENPEMIR